MISSDIFDPTTSAIFEGFLVAEVKPPLLSAKARSSTAMVSSKQHQILGESPLWDQAQKGDR